MPRRSGILQETLQEAFSLKLPKLSPRLVYPPTPISPEADSTQGNVLDWRSTSPLQDDHKLRSDSQKQLAQYQLEPSASGPAFEQAYTPASTPPPECHKAKPGSTSLRPAEPLSFANILQSEQPLHPFLLDNFLIVEELGAGGYGVVVRAIRLHDGLEVAIKLLWRSKVPKDNWMTVIGWEPKLLTAAIVVPREAYILHQVNHPGVISYVDFFEDSEFLYLVMEYFGSPWNVEMAAPASRDVGHDKYQSQLISPSLLPSPPASEHRLSVGSNQGRPTPVRRASCDLFECLEKHERLPEDTARYVFGQLAETVCHLHRKGIVHCDLKDENIVIDSEFRVKIIDFGSALLLDPTLPAPFHQKFRGTINFAAPEILKGHAFQAPQAEVWALGCILSILLTGKGPFATMDAAKKGHLSEPAAPIPLLAFDLMMGCLRADPGDRLNICQVAEHPWLNA